MSSIGNATAKTPTVLRALILIALAATLVAGLSFVCSPSALADELSGDIPLVEKSLEPPQSSPEPETSPTVTAELSGDECVVVLRAQDPSLAAAESVAFDVWSASGGRARAIRHGAVRCEDGSWLATIYIASPTPLEAGVPYNCRIDHAVHRLYNPYNGQHLFTRDVNEADRLSRIGWNYEGVAWIDGDESTDAAEDAPHPVYRLYNPASSDHFYTADPTEYAALPQYGWRQEGISFYSDPDEAQPIYRLYNPYDATGSHHFTSSANEYAALGRQGWRQEGVCWCGGRDNADGSWSLSGGNQPHNDSGLYYVEAIVAFSADAPETVVGQTTFAVTPPTAKASIANIDNTHGTFDVIIGALSSVSGVARIDASVWAADDQTDRRDYRADRQADGTYKVTVRAQDHHALPHYTIDVTLCAGNGVRAAIDRTSCDLALADFVYLEGGPNIYTLSVVNMDPVGEVKAPTWSEANGQDDIVWYEATYQGDRWSATIDTGNFLDSGRCISHIYADGRYRSAFEFQISPKEVLTLRQRAILKAARETPTLGGGLCAGWVSTVLMHAGQPYDMTDDADDMYYRLPLTDLDQILPGMAIAVSTHGHTIAGSIWGHVGIYLGDGQVIDDAYGSVRVMPLSEWVAFYTDRVPVHFGFLEY